MKYKAVLNNYMISHYGKGCLRDMIVKQTRLDRNHTEVIMEIPDEHYYWVQHLIGAHLNPKRLVRYEEDK